MKGFHTLAHKAGLIGCNYFPRVIGNTQRKDPHKGGLLHVGCLRYLVAPQQSQNILNSQCEVKQV